MRIETENQTNIDLEVGSSNSIEYTTNAPDVEIEVNNQNPVTLEIDSPSEITYEIEKNKNGNATTNYEELDNKPKINNVELVGNLTTEDLGIESTGGVKDVEVNDESVVDENGIAKVNVPTKVSQLKNDSGYVGELSTGLKYYYTKTETDKKINELPLGTIINIIETFDYMKRHQQNDIYNANAVNSSVDWTILAILEAFNREVLIDINVQINPITFQIISVDKSFSDIVNAFELGGTTRVVAQLAGTSTKVILQLAMLDSGVASFTTVMKANLGQGEMKYLLGINIAERYQNVVIDVLS